MRRKVAAAVADNERNSSIKNERDADVGKLRDEGFEQMEPPTNFIKGEEEMEETNSDQNFKGGLDTFNEEPDVIAFDDQQVDSKKQTKNSDEKKSLVDRFKALPMPMKIGVVIVAISIFMILRELGGGKKTDVSSETELTSETNLSQPAEVEPKPVPEQSMEKVREDKLNSCLIASPLSFKFGQEGVVPMFGDQVLSQEALFCDEFSLKNYHLDGANNSLSIIGEIYSGQALVKKISVDPLAYFKPSYYLEGISIRHPKTQAEVVYMPGDYILKSPSATLQLTGVTDKGTSVEYGLLLNGQKTAISIDRKFVQ